VDGQLQLEQSVVERVDQRERELVVHRIAHREDGAVQLPGDRPRHARRCGVRWLRKAPVGVLGRAAQLGVRLRLDRHRQAADTSIARRSRPTLTIAISRGRAVTTPAGPPLERVISPA